mmetsp:Transcript_9496/g.23147  ORF Transcript_9496/g.23147 Transcript_9496/m.23147 type:complete len:84 (+) Transcript_9496:86-337(+)
MSDERGKNFDGDVVVILFLFVFVWWNGSGKESASSIKQHQAASRATTTILHHIAACPLIAQSKHSFRHHCSSTTLEYHVHDTA